MIQIHFACLNSHQLTGNVLFPTRLALLFPSAESHVWKLTRALLCVNVFNDQLTRDSSLHRVLLPLTLLPLTVWSSCRPSPGEADVSDSSDQDEVEVIGEKLFALVRDMEPTHCADITGEVIVGL